VGVHTKLVAAGVVLSLASFSCSAASAADLVVLSNQGAIPGVQALATAFEAQTGHRVTVVREVGATLERRIGDGSADLVTGNPGDIAELVANGSVVADTVTPFVLADLGVSVQEGAPKPDISTVESYQAALLAADSIGYSRGCSGTHAAEGIAQLGLADELAEKTIRTESGPVTDYLARREIEIGIQQTNIMVGVPGTEYVGPVPGYLNMPCQSDVGLLKASKEPEAARELIEFMISPAAAPLLRQTHVEPFTP
jgi:molybdate transport system substrate-binding protein